MTTPSVSVARRLAVAIALLATIVTLGAGSWFYHQAAAQAHEESTIRSRQIALYLQGTLQLPLWNIEEEAVKKIGRTLMTDHLVARVKIVDSAGRTVFFESKKGQENPEMEDIPIEYNHSRVGLVTLGYSKDAQEKETRFFLRAVGITFFAVLVVISIGSVLLIRRFLKEPVDQLCLLAESYGASDDEAAGPPVETSLQEFQPLVQVLVAMKNRIHQQINELKDSEGYNKAIFQDSHIPLIIMDAETHRYTDCNDAAVRIYGCGSKAEVLGRQPLDFSAPTQYDGEASETLAAEMIRKALEQGSCLFEWRHRRFDGQVWDGEVQLMSFTYRGKALLQFSLLEITDRKRLEDQLRQSQKMEAIGTLAGGIAHDFNNILTPILGYVELAQLPGIEDHDRRDHLARIRRAAERARDLVGQILTFSRKAEHQKVPVQVAPIVREVMKLIRQTISTTVEVRLDLNSAKWVNANPIQIQQIVMNLCTNAYHAMEETGGVLAVTLREQIVTHIDPPPEDALPPGSYQILEVRDTGCGMSQEICKQIFNPFFTTKVRGKGTGLGLAVVHGIVKDHRGRVTVHSEPGKGSTFQVFLPCVEPGTGESLAGVVIKSDWRGNERVFFVDDEPAIRELVESILSDSGYVVSVFGTGAEALADLAREPQSCDLLITDMSMPGMNGKTVAQAAMGIVPNLPVILCTGYSEILDREEALKMGIREFLRKPLSIDDLLSHVRRVLNESVAGASRPPQTS